MKKYLIHFAALAILASSCRRVEDVSSNLSETSQVLRVDCLMLPAGKEVSRALGVQYEFIPKDDNNKWRSDGWVKSGESVSVTGVKRINIDGRGEWTGVIGEYVLKDGRTISFVVHAPTGNRLFAIAEE